MEVDLHDVSFTECMDNVFNNWQGGVYNKMTKNLQPYMAFDNLSSGGNVVIIYQNSDSVYVTEKDGKWVEIPGTEQKDLVTT